MSGDINLNLDDLNNSQSSVTKISETFYPDGKQTYTNTTQSREDLTGKTLTSADPLKVLQGEGVYRNPAFALNGYIQNVQSSMHGIISMAGDIDGDVKIVDPKDPSGTKYLSGADARQEIAKQSLMTTGYAPGGFNSAMDSIINSKSNSDAGTANDPGGGKSSNSSTVTGSQGEALSHSLKGYVQSDDAEIFNGGSRAIAIADQLSEQEKEVYAKKLKELNSKAKFKGSSLSDFPLSFDTNRKEQDLKSFDFEINQSGGYTADGKYRGSVAIDKTLLGTGTKTCKVSAALIELMLQLTNSIYIRGGTGTDRGIIGNNFSLLTKDNNSVSDHAFGRGFDIMGLGPDQSQEIILGNGSFVAKKVDYMRALHLLFTHMQTISHDLHPDLIVISDELTGELGIKESRIRR